MGLLIISNSVQWLVDSLFSLVRESISAHLSEVDKETLLKICEPSDIFSGLNTRYLREKFYKERFNYVVNYNIIVEYIYITYIQEPTPVLLGSDWEWVAEHNS